MKIFVLAMALAAAMPAQADGLADRPAASVHPQFAQVDPPEILLPEITFWESVRDATDPAELEAYLRAYPDGQFGALALLRLTRLRAGAEGAAPATTTDAAGETALNDCDRLAAHPEDPQRTGNGVSYDDLDATGAIAACDGALRDEPGVARFQFQLGRALAKAQFYEDAIKWYRLAAEQDYAPSQASLAEMYGDGRGVPRDYAEAVAWLRKAGELGLAQAQFDLGYVYETGRFVDPSPVEAISWYQRAAEQGHVDAITELRLYYYENGDFSEALRWNHRAIAAGDLGAYSALGGMYMAGQGVIKDEREAVRWFCEGARAGDELATDELLRILDARDNADATLLLASAQAEACLVSLEGPAPLEPLGEPAVDFAEIQRALGDLGYDPGPIDGAMGNRTREAIQRYQNDRGLAIDGEPSPALFGRLQEDLANRRAPAAGGSQPTGPIDDLGDLGELDTF